MLTDLKIKRYKSLHKRSSPKAPREILWDTGGLGILMGKKKRTWVFRYSFDGRRLLLTLGEYPAMSLEEARKDAAEVRLSVKRGIDPGAVKKEAKQARKAAPTIEDIVEEFWAVELSKQKSGKERKRLLTHDVVSVWGKRKVADIKRRDLVILLDSIENRSAVTRNHVHGTLSRMFNFAAERGIIDDSPCTRIRKPKETARSRVLTDDELKLLLAALAPDNRAVDVYVITKLALKMILLTGQRPGEVTGMRWDEIDLEAKFWTIPEGRMKGQEAHRVPLASMALEIIEHARIYSGDNPFVFRSSYKDGAPVTRAALSRAVVRHWKVIGLQEPFTPHDLRRTLRTRLAELGIDDIVAERVLGHKLQGVLGVYNRHPYDKEKRQALEKWESKLNLIVGLDRPI